MYLVHIQSNMDEARFMTYIAANHALASLLGAVVSSIFIYSQWSKPIRLSSFGGELNFIGRMYNQKNCYLFPETIKPLNLDNTELHC